MSYDLTLRKRDGRFDEAAALDWFRARPFYQVENRQAIYDSADSGVHFIFELRSAPDDGEDDEEEYDLHFSLNYFRPSYFVLEAEREVTAFVRDFDFIVNDPQIDGMGEDRYDGQALIAAWTQSLETTLPAFLSEPGARQNLATLPTARLTELWRWNYGRKALQGSLGDHIFVPKVLILRVEGQPRTAIVWGDGIAAILPTVDLIVIHREQFAPWRLLGRRPDQVLMPWADAAALVAPHSAPHADGALMLTYDHPPKAIVDCLKALPKSKVRLDLVGPDGVLDREMVERALGVRQ